MYIKDKQQRKITDFMTFCKVFSYGVFAILLAIAEAI